MMAERALPSVRPEEAWCRRHSPGAEVLLGLSAAGKLRIHIPFSFGFSVLEEGPLHLRRFLLEMLVGL